MLLSQHQRDLLLRTRPGTFTLLFGLWRWFSSTSPLFALFMTVDLCLVPSEELSVLVSLESFKLWAEPKPHRATLELALANWQRANAAVCLWSHGSSSKSSSGFWWSPRLLVESLMLRFRGNSDSCCNFSVSEHNSLWSNGHLSLSCFLLERLRGARSTLLSSSCSDMDSWHCSGTDTVE